MKKMILFGTILLSSLIACSSITEASELSDMGENQEKSIIIQPSDLRMKPTNPYVFEIPIHLSSERAREMYNENPNMSASVDFTEATFYDENYNELNKDDVINSIYGKNINSRTTVGGTWGSGSGYAYCKGMKVSHTNAFSTSDFKVDFEHRQQGYDKINRIYEKNWGSWIGDVSGVQSGVFRANETSTYSAYGGIKYTLSGIGIPSGRASRSVSNYIRVGNDKYWQEVR